MIEIGDTVTTKTGERIVITKINGTVYSGLSVGVKAFGLMGGPGKWATAKRVFTDKALPSPPQM